MAVTAVERLEHGSDLGEMGSPAVVGLERLPVLLLPPAVRQFDVADPPADIRSDWDRQPFEPLGRLDPVAVAPVVLCKLRVVIEDELIYCGNHVEIPLPGDVVRLQDGHLLHRFLHSDGSSPRSQSASAPRSTRPPPRNRLNSARP